MKKIKVNKKTANFLKYVEAIITMLMVMLGMVASTSFFSLTPIGWCLEITMMIMLLVVTGIVEEKPDINNADVYAPNVNVSEQHVVQQSHERNEEDEDESPLLFIIICILMLLAILSVSNFIENYYLY